MSSQILQAQKGHGLSFHFKFPKTGLSLRSVDIEKDSLPRIHFDCANCRELPTLTEEDFATVARVVSEGKRPEFFYAGILNPHPFFGLGRAYKLYSPQWLRGTSIGELLSETDWSMKCLHVGTRSNKSKTEFWSWQKTSKLDNLAVHMDFPKEDVGPTLMSCDSVKTEQSENEILFVDEPKIKITDETSPMYSKYITHYYDNVAYYDEPLFLKMQELIKLIVAIEWMKEKGITFNKEWMNNHTKNRQQQQSQAVAIKPIEDKDAVLKQASNAIKKQMQQDMQALNPNGSTIQDVKITQQTPTGIELTATSSCPALSMEVVKSVRMSFNDFNFLYSDWFDYKLPITFDENGKAIKPDVSSWSELFEETVSMPKMIGVFHNNEKIIQGGGIQTQQIPVKTKKVEEVTRPQNTVYVPASHRIDQPKHVKHIDTIQKPCVPPSKNVPAGTMEALFNKSGITKTNHGFIDAAQGTMQTAQGEIIDHQSFKTTNKHTMMVGGQIVTETTKSGIFPFGVTAKRQHSKTTCNSKQQASSKKKCPPDNQPKDVLTKSSQRAVKSSQNSCSKLQPLQLEKEGMELIQNNDQSMNKPLELELPDNNTAPLSPTSSDSGFGSSASSTIDTNEDDQTNTTKPQYDTNGPAFKGGVDVGKIWHKDNDIDSGDESGTEDEDTEIEDN